MSVGNTAEATPITETRYIDCKAADIPGSLKGMREVLDGWLALGTSESALVVLDDLQSVVKTEAEVSLHYFSLPVQLAHVRFDH